MFITVDERVLPEKDTFVAKAGTTIQDYFLYGLRYKLTVRTAGTVSAVHLFSSGTPEDESNKFSFTDEGNGVYTYEETAGENATDISLIGNASANFADGVKFYFRIKIITDNLPIIIDKLFWVRDPNDIMLFLGTLTPYESPYPVLIGASAVPLAIATTAKNESGEVLRGGIATAEVFSTPSAPSSGSHVTTVAETAVASLTSITLPNRDNAGSIPGFIPPPGAPDYSRYYHYITFRLRSKAGSAHYRDIAILLFAAQNCSPVGGDYGWGSNGSDTVPAPVAPPNFLIIIGIPNPPTEVCNSFTILETDTSFNVYAQQSLVSVYDAAIDGVLLGQGLASILSETQLKITRAVFGGDVSFPVAGFFEVTESGPDRTSSDRAETYIDQCATPGGGYETTTIEYNQTTAVVDVTTTGASDTFVSSKTYQIRMYDAQYGGTLDATFSATYLSDHVLTFETAVDISGFFSIVEDAVEVTGQRFSASVVITEAAYFWFFDRDAENWIEMDSTNTPPNRYDHAIFESSGGFYIYGGRTLSGEVLGDFWLYDGGLDSWTQLADPPPGKRYGATYTKHSEEGYFGGGFDENNNPVSDWWFFEVDIPVPTWTARGTPPVAFRRNSIIGNYPHARYLESHAPLVKRFYDFDFFPPPPGNIWTINPIGTGYMPVATDFCATFDESGTYYYCGGKTISGGVAVNHFYKQINSADAYVQLANAPKAFYHGGISERNDDFFYVFGGVDSAGNLLNETWKYTAGTDTWTTLSPAISPSARKGCVLSRISIKIIQEFPGFLSGFYLFGGKT